MKFLLLLLVIIPIYSFSQYKLREEINWHGFTYYGRQPSAKIEALGAGAVTLGEDVFSNFYNPAGISLLKNVEINSSLSFPSNNNYKNKTLYEGMGYKYNKYLKFGLSFFNHSYQETNYNIDEQDPVYFPNDISRSLYTLTVASEPLKNFHCGLNISLLQWRYNTFTPTTAILMDFGTNKKYEISSKNKNNQQSISIASSIYNFTFSHIDRKTEFYTNKVKIPVYFGLGFNYFLSLSKAVIKPELTTFELTSHLEFQKVLSTEYHTAIRTGFEIKFLELFLFRLGYYYEIIPETNHYKNLSNFTYGIGLQFPIHKFTKNKIPIIITIDYTYLNDPLYGTVVFVGSKKYHTFGIKIKWNYNKNSDTY